MPAQTVDNQLNAFLEQSSLMARMWKIQTDALSEIACCEVSLDGGVAMKAIAERALIECYLIDQGFQEKVTQN